MAYDASIQASGDTGFLDSFDLSPTANVPVRINDLKDWMTSHGWTETGATPAHTYFIFFGAPSRSGSGGAPQHSGPVSGYMGKYTVYTFQLWDPGADSPPDSDPTGGGVVGVPLGTSVDQTISNFAAAATFATGYVFTFLPFDGTRAVGTVVAGAGGPLSNIDSNSIFVWNPPNFASSAAPKEGGWYLESTATDLGDKLRAWIFEEFFEHLTIQTRAIDADGNVVDWAPQGFNSCHYRAAVCPYQFAFQKRKDSAIPGTDGIGSTDPTGTFLPVTYGAYLLASAPFVPDKFQAVAGGIAALADDGITPMVITTLAPHKLLAGGIFWLKDATPPALNGRWYVAEVLSPTTFKVTRVRGNPAYVGVGTAVDATIYSQGVKSACVQFRGGSLDTKPYVDGGNPLRCDSVVNGEAKSGSMTGRLGVMGALLPVINTRDRVDGLNIAGKPIRQAPYVAVASRDDEECRIAGILWDFFVELTTRNYEDMAIVEGDRFMSWMQTKGDFSPLANMSLWVRAVLG